MKKTLLLGIACLAVAGGYAQAGVEPKVLEEFYGQKMSPDGKWIYSNPGLGESVIYDLSTDKFYVFYEIYLGNGNSIANNGTCVGATESGQAIVIKGEKNFTPSAFENYWFSTINGITTDATKVVGIVANPKSGGSDDDDNQMYLPYISDIDADGNCGELIFLPHPSKDFIGLTPQYCSATWISDDGKTILGQLIDNSGMFIQPIYYRQDESGEWSYFLPSEPLYNPEHIVLPEYPGEFDDSLYPEPTDYMTPEKAEEYNEDLEYWRENMSDPNVAYPGDHLEDYMTIEQAMAYNEAVEAYNEYVTEYNEKMFDYLNTRNAIFNSSPSFVQNASALNAEGTVASLTSLYVVDDGGEMPQTLYGAYSLDLVSGKMTEIKTNINGLIAGQVLDGNIFLSSTSAGEYPAAYVYLPGAEGFIPVQDYFAETNPGAVSWMEEKLVHELAPDPIGGSDPYSAGTRADDRMALISGLGMASRDFSVYAGAVPAYMFDPVLYYLTYVFDGLSTEVKSISVADNSALKIMRDGVMAISGEVTDLAVVDLSGRKVFGMQNANGVINTNLKRGIYVVTYTDAEGQRVSRKINF